MEANATEKAERIGIEPTSVPVRGTDNGFEDREDHQAPFTLRIADFGLRKDYFAFLIAVTMASKSGQSPVSSLEWSNLPLARISKAPPLEGINVSDLMRSPSSRILVAKLTAFGV